jgi:hypothetical protein
VGCWGYDYLTLGGGAGLCDLKLYSWVGKKGYTMRTVAEIKQISSLILVHFDYAVPCLHANIWKMMVFPGMARRSAWQALTQVTP